MIIIFSCEDMFTEHYCRWDRYTGWDLLSLTGLLAGIFYFKQVRLKQHQNPYPWPPTVYQDLGIFEKVWVALKKTLLSNLPFRSKGNFQRVSGKQLVK